LPRLCRQFHREAEPPHAHSQAEPEEREKVEASGGLIGGLVEDLARFAKLRTKDDENNTTDQPVTTITAANFFANPIAAPVGLIHYGLPWGNFALPFI
jgi:hypothetical protein